MAYLVALKLHLLFEIKSLVPLFQLLNQLPPEPSTVQRWTHDRHAALLPSITPLIKTTLAILQAASETDSSDVDGVYMCPARTLDRIVLTCDLSLVDEPSWSVRDVAWLAGEAGLCAELTWLG